MDDQLAFAMRYLARHRRSYYIQGFVAGCLLGAIVTFVFCGLFL